MVRDIIDRYNPYLEFRPGQHDCISGVVKAAKAGKKVIQVDAGVGSGKSLILTVAARVLIAELGFNFAVYSTPQVKLVEQIRNDKLLNVPTIVGKANYPCTALPLLNITAEDCPLPKRLRKIACSKCPYQEAKAAFDAARLGALTLDKLLFDKSISTPDILIIDESSGIENKLIKQSEIPLPEHIKTATKEDLIESLEDWASSLNKEIKRLLESQEMAAVLICEGDESEKVLTKAARIGRELRKNEQKLRKVEYLLEMLAEGQKYVIDKDRKFRLLDGKRPFAELCKGPALVILASGTPCPQMVCDDSVTISMPNPIPESQRLVYYDPVGKMSSAVRKDTIGKMAPMIAELHNRFKKHTLIHCHSYQCSLDLGNLVADQGIDVISMAQDTKEDDIKRWMRNDNIALASVGCEEGLDLKGPNYPLNIIAVVPFPFRGDKWVIEREKADLEQGLPYFKQHGIIETAVAIQQAVGRTTRGPDDYSESFILDENFGWFCGRYRQAFKTDFLSSIRVRAPAGGA